MKWIKEILEKYTKDGILDVESATTEINKKIPTLFVSKDVYNTVASEKKAAEAKVKEYETGQLTETEKTQKAIEDANAEKEKYLKANAKLKAESILVKSGLMSEDYEEFIDGIVSTDEDATAKLAESLAKTLGTKVKAAEDAMKEQLLKNTPKPNGGDGNNGDERSNAEKIAETMAKNISQSKEDSSKGLNAYLGGN